MDLSIDNLKSVGAFTGAPVRKEISWQHNSERLTAVVHVRHLSYHSAVSDVIASSGKADAIAGRIASCICDANGKAVFTPGDITGDADPERGPLDGNLTVALLEVIAEVNNLGGKPHSERSPQKTNSGTSSSSMASAAAPSRKPKRNSATPSSSTGGDSETPAGA